MDPNFQQMGGPGQMMPQQQMQQQPQRQAQGPNATAHIQSMIYSTLQSQTGNLSGWRTQVLPNERVGLIFNIIGNLRLASQHQPNPPNLQRMIEIGLRFEKDIFDRSESKEIYKNEVQMKLEQLLERRVQNQAGMQQQIHQQAQAQAQAQQAQAQAQQQMMMNQNNMQGQANRAMPQQPAQQSFSHLQRQMQASPLPGQQPQQAPMGLPNQGPPQNMNQNQQQQFVPMQQQQQNLGGRPGNGQPQMSPQENAAVNELTNRLMSQASEEEKNTLRTNLQQRMDPSQFNKYQSQGVDPIFMFFRNQAVNRFRQERSQRMQQAQAQQQLALAQQPQNGQAAVPMQPQRSMNPSPMNGQAQPPASVGGNPDFSSFMGNIGDLAVQQQQQGVMAEQAGQMVVPANPPRNGTPQPGVMPGQGIDMVSNPNPRAQQQQQMFNAQQMQQQRLQHAQQQQQQQQSQARLNAQQKAQQIGLRGQPGGMGPGPNPSPSPGMTTLNAPLRTPSQPMNHSEPPQANLNAQFGQPLDPRFMQGNQRQGPGNGMAVAGLNPAMFPNMAPDAQRALATMPQEKLNDVVTKWHESRTGQMNATNMPGGRPQMSMQGPGQARPGQQMPTGGQFNTPNGANQFMMGNAVQRPPPSMAAGMNAQQQMILQQQMNTLRQNQMQQRGAAPNNAQLEQRTMAQMDNVDIPQIFQNHANMPQGSPPEIKKWGQLKQWVSQNPNLAPNSLEAVKTLQRMHYMQAMRSKAHQQGQAGGMQPGGPGPQNGMPTGPPVMAAPVAPMGQQPMQMPNGVNMASLGSLRQPTPQDIHNMRNHPSGKLLHANDDQLRTMFLKQQASQLQAQLTPQQQQQRQQMMALQMSRMQQANSQQPQMNGQPQPIPHQMGLGQPKPGQPPQPKQVQTGPNSGPQSHPEGANASLNAASSRPAARAQPNGRNGAQNSSPAQPPKNLKRASSDEVVEVPNPNIQQPRQTPQQGQDSNKAHQSRPTQQQLAGMDPETRKKYENSMRAAQMAQAQSNLPSKMQASDQGNRWQTILREEHERSSKEPHTEIPMDEETKKKMATALLSVLQGVNNVGKALPKYFAYTQDEAQVRRFLQARTRFSRQFRIDITQPNPPLKDSFSINFTDIDHIRTMLSTIVKALTEKFPNMRKPDGAAKAQQPSASQAEPQTSHPAQNPAPLNAANLQQQQQQLNKLHQRSNSRSSHTPAAPTSTQPPFQFGATSPHGTPAYAGKTTLKQEDLHIPARKKQKQNSTPVPGQGTPGSTSSPHVPKAVSPDLKRQQSEVKQQNRLCCSEPECDRHHIGFESQEALKAHTQEEHIRPLENPLKYVQENLAATLGLDSNGQSKRLSIPMGTEAGSTPTAAKMVASGSKQGQTPTIKGENTPAGATPMNRQVSMNRQGSAAGVKANMPPKAVATKEAPGKPQPGQKDMSKPKEAQPSQAVAVIDPWAQATVDPHDLFQSFQAFESGAGGAISDMNVYRSITPNDTPESSKDGVSEPNSDVSEGVGLDITLDMFDDKWMPFGPNDTEGFFDLSSFNVTGEEDLLMFDGDAPAVTYQSWDDMVDPLALDKPFIFDTSLYSMSVD